MQVRKLKNENNKKKNNNVDVTVNVDVSKIVRNVGVAGVLIVGIIFGCSTYRKVLKWQRDDYEDEL